MPSELTFLPAAAQRVLIAANPKAGARSSTERVAALAEALAERGFGVEILTDLVQLERLAGDLLADGTLRCVVAAGGDGTVSELVNRLDANVPLAVLPLGTENLLAKYLGVTCHPDRVAEVIARGAAVRLDAARANGRIFLITASAGFDAEVVRRLHTERKGHIRHWSYLRPILSTLVSYRYPELRVHCELEPGEAPTAVHARWAFLTNLPRYAGRLRFAPLALGADGLLDLCTFRHGSLWHGLRYLAFVVLGRHTCLDDCGSRQVRRVRIESDEPVPYQLDGDAGGMLPLTVEVLPARLLLVVPEGWATANGFRAPAVSEVGNQG